MFKEVIKQPYPAFNPYTKARYPGREIVRQEDYAGAAGEGYEVTQV